MYHTTGFSRNQITDLCALVQQAAADDGKRFWPPILGLFKSVTVALTYMRRNRVQDELAETFGVSQPTISRAVTGLTSVLGAVLADYEAYSGEAFCREHRRVEMKDGPFTSRIGLPHSSLKETDRRRVSYHWLLPGSDNRPVRTGPTGGGGRRETFLATDSGIVQVGHRGTDVHAAKPRPR